MKLKMKAKKDSLLNKVAAIKVRLDHRTIITIKTKEALKNWMQRYPDAKVIS